MRVAVIPARGGSLRIPRKNIKQFCGKPMIAWPIETAKASGLFDRVIVSTDDDEIGRVAEACGAEVPFLRPASLADHHTGTTDVVRHATQWAVDIGWPVESVCCLYATAASVETEDLRKGLAAIESGDWMYAFSVTAFAAPLSRSLRLTKAGGIEMFFPEFALSRSQDLPKAFHDAGQFYWGRSSAWLAGAPIFAESSYPVILPRWRVQDVDEPEDWARAEIIFKVLKGGGNGRV